MARKKRVQEAHLIYHVMSRGNGRMTIFEDDHDYRCFMTLFGEVVEDFEIECWNYCLMPNHYHLTLQPTQPNLSRAMKQLNATYAQRWNKRHDRVGHVFQGPFKDQIVQREGYLPALCRYVALNPRRARLVSQPEDWQWSSYGAIAGTCAAPSFLNAAATLDLFGPGEEGLLQAAFREFVCGDPDKTLEERFRSNDRIIGDRAFRAGLRPRPAPIAPKTHGLRGGLNDAARA